MRRSLKQSFDRRPGLRDPIFIAGLLVIYAYVFATPLYAYLDPGTGSFLFQLLIGAVVGGIFVIKSYWLRLKNWISGTKPEVEQQPDAPVSEKTSAEDLPQDRKK